MLLLLSAIAAIHVQSAQQGHRQQRRTVAVRDSVVADSSATHKDHKSRNPVTAQVLASAFKDQTARASLLQARAARLRQDSALVAYDAMSYQRVSAGMALTSFGRDRLMFRHESAAHIRWRSGVGAYVDVKGSRTAVPLADNEDMQRDVRREARDPDMMAAIPYYPGYEPLWVGGDVARTQVDESEIIHPIADGSEAYYTYETGDSISFKLPDGKVIQLRELRFRPRKPKWNVVVGSAWLDTKSGQLVRAAYRLSVPMDIWAVATEDDPKSMDDVPAWVKPMITPMKAEVTAIAIEYSLHEGRFWLPRLRLAEGRAQVSFMHVPFKLEQSFKYESVNARDSLPLPPIQVASLERQRMLDTMSEDRRQEYRDSVRAATRARVRAENDSVRDGLKKRAPRVSQCDTANTTVTTSNRHDGLLPVLVRVPCNAYALEHSSDLPPSIYDPGEELFGAKELEQLKNEALSLSAQAPFSLRMQMLPPPTFAYGPSMIRYNRIEGLSFGGSAEQQLGGGYSALGVARLGLADLEPNVDLTVTRTNLTETIRVSGYNHLVSASDWGRPLSFSSSFSALMFGRDEGFYYRASGAEISGGREASFGGGTRIDWRAFVERQRNAAVKTTFAVNGADFPANLVARRGTYSGFAAHVNNSYGLDPRGLRVFSDLRVETAVGDSLYGRGALDLTVSHGFGQLAAALTGSGGSSIGALPAQRRWYLGGSQTIRGQSPDTAQSGNAFWLVRAEVGSNRAGVRPTVFGDLGWTGDRTNMSQVGVPMSGVGAGVSFMDGLFRFDVARGINPRKQFRVDLYLESKF